MEVVVQGSVQERSPSSVLCCDGYSTQKWLWRSIMMLFLVLDPMADELLEKRIDAASKQLRDLKDFYDRIGRALDERATLERSLDQVSV